MRKKKHNFPRPNKNVSREIDENEPPPGTGPDGSTDFDIDPGLAILLGGLTGGAVLINEFINNNPEDEEEIEFNPEHEADLFNQRNKNKCDTFKAELIKSAHNFELILRERAAKASNLCLHTASDIETALTNAFKTVENAKAVSCDDFVEGTNTISDFRIGIEKALPGIVYFIDSKISDGCCTNKAMSELLPEAMSGELIERADAWLAKVIINLDKIPNNENLQGIDEVELDHLKEAATNIHKDYLDINIDDFEPEKCLKSTGDFFISFHAFLSTFEPDFNSRITDATTSAALGSSLSEAIANAIDPDLDQASAEVLLEDTLEILKQLQTTGGVAGLLALAGASNPITGPVSPFIGLFGTIVGGAGMIGEWVADDVVNFFTDMI